MMRKGISILSQNMNGRRNRIKLKSVLSIILFIFSIVFTIIMRQRDYVVALSEPLYTEVYKITELFQVRQIIASLFFFFVGYLIITVIIPELPDIFRMILAIPTSIVVWGTISIIVLLLRLPYTKQLMFLIQGILAIVFIYILARRKTLALRHFLQFIIRLAVVSSFVNIISTGIIRYTVASDTYYYIYTYGRLIAKAGKLSAESMGNLLETTGPMMAVMASFAVFCGFETIQIIHFMLIFSFLGLLVYYLYHIICTYGADKKKAGVIVAFILGCAISPLFLISNLIISHSWMMVFLFICSFYMKEYINTINYNIRQKIIGIMSLYLLWMSFLRIEAIITILFLIVCFTYLGISRRELLILSFPTLVMNAVFHIEMQFLIRRANDHLSYGTVFVTPKALIIIFLAIILMGGYIVFYNIKLLKIMRGHLPVIIIVSLLAASVIICLPDKERTINNFHSIFYNLANERWYYFPHLVALLTLIILKGKKNYGFWDMITFGMILLNFAMCMGRVQYLRDGWGDSFNRYLLQAVPFMLVFLTDNIGEIVYGLEKAERAKTSI